MVSALQRHRVCPKVNGRAQPIVDADGAPVKGEANREKALALWHERVARERAPTNGLDNPDPASVAAQVRPT